MFYERFLELCTKNNIAPSAAATKAGFNRGTVSVWKKKYLLGQDVVAEKDVITKICNFFGCSEQWLRGISSLGDDIKKEKPTDQQVSELDDITRELRDIWDAADHSTREAILAAARMFKARGN